MEPTADSLKKSGWLLETVGAALDRTPTPGTPDELPPGTVLEGTYRVDGVIARGGMGAVYVVEHVKLGKKFAAKLVLGEHAKEPVAMERLRFEARLASTIEHENVVTVSHLGELPDGGVFMVMELLRGVVLRALLDERLDAHERGEQPAWLTLEEVDAILEPMLAGVSAAHRAGIVHRDLKPENVFLCQRGDRVVPKILDFGIGKVAESDARLTATGQVVGTPMYMAPEQLRSSGVVDARTDIYAIGLILFELLCGRTPFQATNAFELILMHANQTPPSPRALREDLPRRVAEVVLKCLEKDAADRHASADALLEAWRSARAGRAPVAAPEPQDEEISVESPAAPDETRRLQRGVFVAFGGVALIAGIALVATVLNPSQPAPRAPSEDAGARPETATVQTQPVEAPSLEVPAAPTTDARAAPTEEVAAPIVATPTVVAVAAPPPERAQPTRRRPTAPTTISESPPLPAPPAPPPQPSGEGFANIAVPGGGWAEVLRNGVRLGEAPGRFTLPAGHQTLTVRDRAGTTKQVSVEITAGATARVVVRFDGP